MRRNQFWSTRLDWRKVALIWLSIITLPIEGFSQAGEGLTSRDIYISGASPPPKPSPGKPSSSVTQTSLNLALRFNVLVTDPSGRTSKVVDPERVFRSGECLVLELQANVTGYIYVLAKNSAGWEMLVPSDVVREKLNEVKGGTVVRVPRDECFEIVGPPRTEQLFVILSQERADIDLLLRASISSKPVPTAQGINVEASQQAKLSIGDAEMERLQTGLRSRDLRVKKFEEPVSKEERPFTIYAADDSLSPSKRITYSIYLKHQ